MLRNVRKKIATSLSEIESGDDFLYNSWLRLPPNQGEAIGSITSSLDDTSEIGLELDEPYASQHFFLLNESELFQENDNYFFSKVKTNPIFFNLLIVPSKVTFHTDIEPKPAGFSAKKIDFAFRINSGFDIPILFDISKPSKVQFKIRLPGTNDYLENLKTKVVKVELLSLDDIISGDADSVTIKQIQVVNFGKINVDKVKVPELSKSPKLAKVKVPGMGTYKSKVAKLIMNSFRTAKVSKSPNLKFAGTSVKLSNFNFDDSNSLTYFDTKDRSSAKAANTLSEMKNPEQVKDVIKLILKKANKADWNKWKKTHSRLSVFEETAVKFLAENERAFIGEELGIDKTKETLYALKFLLDNRVINSALIISTKHNLNNNNEKHFPYKSDWLSNIEQTGIGLPYSLVYGSDDERESKWEKTDLIKFVDYPIVLSDYKQKLLKDSQLADFECIIFDDVEILLNPNKNRDLLNVIKPRFLWMLSSIANESVLAKLNEILPKDLRIENCLVRQLSKTSDQSSCNYYTEYWLDMDEHQQVEYNITFKDCKKELRKILESGNPLRFQANIFTLLHKLYQVCNFAHGYDTNEKTELLMHHVNIIKQNKKKVLILSQYDRQGIKKLQNLFDRHKINYITVQSGLSADDLKKAISLFKSKKTVTVFLSNAKESNLDFGDYAIPYVIRFDSWWNPAIITHTKNMFNSKKIADHKSRTFVISYHINNTIEEQIRKLLMDRGLLERALLKVMPVSNANDLLSIDEWIEIFGFPVEGKPDVLKFLDETENRIKNLSLGDYRATISKFLSTIGYINIDILEHENSASFDITGDGKSGRKNVYMFGRVFIDSEVFVKDVQNTILDASGSNRNSVFIFTRAKISDSVKEYAAERDDLVVLDNYLLAKYLVNLKLVHQSKEQAEEE